MKPDSIEALAKAFDEHHSEVADLADGYKALQEQLDRIEAQVNKPPVVGGGRHHDHSAALTAERKALATFARTGDKTALRSPQNSLLLGDDTAGGYTESPALSDQINKKLFDAAPMLGLVRVVTMGPGSSWEEPVDTSDADASWVSETETRSETSAGSFGLNTIPLDESTAMVKLTQRLLDDSRFDLAGYVTSKLVDRFARLEDAAFVVGTGIKQPKGILSYATSTTSDGSRAAQTYQHVVSGNATALTADGIVNLYYSLHAPYRKNSTWLMASDTARQVRLLKDGNGAYLWSPSLAAASPDTLCGRPVIIDETMPQVAAASYPIAVADWQRAYVAIQRPGLKFLRDPYSAKPYVLLYATRRVGGQSSGISIR